MIALLVAALGWSGAVHVDGGFTPSTRSVVLPAAPEGATSVRVRVHHEVDSAFAWETDSYGGPVVWSCDASLRAGWTLRSGVASVACGRVSRYASVGGLAVPFDGVFDWGGPSGHTISQVLASGSDWIDLPLSAPLSLVTRAQTAWSVVITAPFVPPSGGSVAWLNRTTWSADVDFEYLRAR